MSVKIIIINGLGGCGKSTFTQLCKSIGEREIGDIRCFELSSVDFVKEVAVFCGWNGEKTTKNRSFLHDLKVALEKWDDIPNKKVIEQIEQLTELKKTNIFFVNIRENYNIKAFTILAKEKGYECYSLFMTNPNIVSNEVPEIVEQIINYNYDFVVTNDGDLRKLRQLSKDFLKELLV